MTCLIELNQWEEWMREASYTLLPAIAKFPMKKERIDSWERAWAMASPNSFLLESGKQGQYTYLGLETSSRIYGKGLLGWKEELGRKTKIEGKPLQVVKDWMAAHQTPRVPGDGPHFLGGCVGYWGYDVAHSIERLPYLRDDDMDLPDYSFMRVDQLWIVDHLTSELYCVHWSPIAADPSFHLVDAYHSAQAALHEMKTKWDDITHVQWSDKSLERKKRYDSGLDHVQHLNDPLHEEKLQSAFPQAHFESAVTDIQEYIRSGDVFQVNLSLRQSRPLSVEPEVIYEWLRLLNPSPYMGLLRYPEFQLVSASPELLVKLRQGTISTRPIAGTRRRGRTEEEDRELAHELIDNDKERAEHVMLVDLLRNDLGRVSAYGTVSVEDFMVIEYYSHVMHIVSEVQGKLAEGMDGYDILASVFPGGTITGAPKIRTMEIIEELEPTRRGPYTGSMGWIDYNGDMEFNIIIRTLVIQGGTGYVQAGAGIVIDSDPSLEYKESLNKARALWKAVELATEDQTP